MLLSGLRVLDLSRVLAGPICTMMLGDYGADVVKVERPPAGDDSRGWGPPFDERGESAYFLCANRNKLSVALDFDDPRDCGMIRALALEADVIVDNFRPGVLERRGLDPAELLSAKSRLIWCTLSGFGNESGRGGYDFVIQAEAGWMSITGEPSGSPMKIGMALADVIAGKDAAVAILAALTARERGLLEEPVADRHLKISLVHSATAALVNVAQNVLVSGRDAARWGNAHPNLCPYELFETGDAPIVISVGSDAQWLACARALGLAELAADESLRTNAGRLAERKRIVSAMSSRLRIEASAHWLTVLSASGVPCGAVKSVQEALGAVAASPLSGVFPSAPGRVRFPPPMLNEHGAMIRERGWGVFDEAFPLAAPRVAH